MTDSPEPVGPGSFKYWAFLSYSHTDKRFVRRFYSSLEGYRTPKDLRAKRPEKALPAKLFPIFRDMDELPTSSDLGEEIRGALRSSRHLIVMCSPAAAQSRWVNAEILDFKRMHGEGRILAVILSGEPNATDKSAQGFTTAQECFPEALKYRLGPDGSLDKTRRTEPIAADVRPGAEGGVEKARIKVLAKLLDVGFDELWDREQRRKMRFLLKVSAAAAAMTAIFAGISVYAVHQRDVAEAQSARAERQKKMALDTLQRQTFGIPQRLKHVDGAMEILQPIIQENIEMLEKVLDGEPETPQSLHLRIQNLSQAASTLQLFGATQESIAALRRALSYADQFMRLEPGDPLGASLAALTHEQLALSLQTAHAFPEARQEVLAAIRLSERAAPGSSLDALLKRAASCQNLLSLKDKSDIADQDMEALKLVLDRLRELRPSLDGAQRLKVAETLFSADHEIGQRLLEQFRLSEAQQAFEAALESASAMKASDSPNRLSDLALFMVNRDLGRTRQATGDAAGALACYQAAKDALDVLARREPKNIQTLGDRSLLSGLMGQLHQDNNDLLAARSEYGQAVEGYRRLAEQDPGDAEAKRELGNHICLLAQLAFVAGNREEAMRLYEENLEITRSLTSDAPANAWHCQMLASAHANLGSALGDTAEMNNDLGLAEQGLRHLKTSLKLLHGQPGSQLPPQAMLLVGSYADASICHLVLGDVPAAKEAITQARSIMQTLDASGLQPMAQAVEERYRNIMAR